MTRNEASAIEVIRSMSLTTKLFVTLGLIALTTLAMVSAALRATTISVYREHATDNAIKAVAVVRDQLASDDSQAAVAARIRVLRADFADVAAIHVYKLSASNPVVFATTDREPNNESLSDEEAAAIRGGRPTHEVTHVGAERVLESISPITIGTHLFGAVGVYRSLAAEETMISHLGKALTADMAIASMACIVALGFVFRVLIVKRIRRLRRAVRRAAGMSRASPVFDESTHDELALASNEFERLMSALSE